MFQVCNMNVCFRVSVSVSLSLSVCLSLAVYFVLAFLSPKTLFSLQHNYNSLLFIDNSAVSRTFCLLFLFIFYYGTLLPKVSGPFGFRLIQSSGQCFVLFSCLSAEKPSCARDSLHGLCVTGASCAAHVAL